MKLKDVQLGCLIGCESQVYLVTGLSVGPKKSNLVEVAWAHGGGLSFVKYSELEVTYCHLVSQGESDD